MYLARKVAFQHSSAVCRIATKPLIVVVSVRGKSTNVKALPTTHRRPNYSGYYNAILEQNVEHIPEKDAAATDAVRSDQKGGVIFYSRLAGYPENKPSVNEVKMYAGVIVPAKPDEPLNCCQSGCVHCVWDIYREDIEHYQAKRDEARQALVRIGKPIPVELGGAAEQLDIIGQLDPALQAFIKLEKELKQKRATRETRATSD